MKIKARKGLVAVIEKHSKAKFIDAHEEFKRYLDGETKLNYYNGVILRDAQNDRMRAAEDENAESVRYHGSVPNNTND